MLLATFENSLAVPQMLNIELLYYPTILASNYLPRNKNTCPIKTFNQIFIAALSYKLKI